MITYDLKKFFYVLIALLQFDVGFIFVIFAYIFTDVSIICALFAFFSFALGGWSINRLRKGEEVLYG